MAKKEQTVQVSLSGVLALQAEVIRNEQIVEEGPEGSRPFAHSRLDGLRYAVQVLGLPVIYQDHPRPRK